MIFDTDQIGFSFDTPTNAMAQRFLEFDKANPHVYDLFKRYTFTAIKSGVDACSSSLIVERIRWEVAMNTTDAEFKIPNEYRAFFARKFMRDFPVHAGFFNCKKSAADELYPQTEGVTTK